MEQQVTTGTGGASDLIERHERATVARSRSESLEPLGDHLETSEEVCMSIDANAPAHDDATTRQDLTADLMDRASEKHDTDERLRLLDEVVLLNMPPARGMARRFRGRGVADDDLEQVAYTALVQATRRFDPDYGTPFLSFAAPYVRGEIKKHFRDHGWMVKPSRVVQELQARIGAAREDLGHRLGRSPRPSEIARELDVDHETVVHAMAVNGYFTPSSLDRHVGGDDDLPALGDTLPDSHDDRPAAEARVVLGPLVRRLGDRDRRIVEMRFFEDRTQREIGEEIGVTQMHVSRLIQRILDTLREQLDGRGPTLSAV